MTPRFLGVHRRLALFESRGKSIVVNTKTLDAYIQDEHIVASAELDRTKLDPVWAEIAAAVVKRDTTPATISMSQSAKRTYTVPKRVAESAASAVTASGNASPIAKHVASTLCSGEQCTLEDVLWVSRFFDTHDEESTARATWLSWGGNEGKRWSEGLAGRLNYDAVVADAGMYETPGVQDFVEGTESDRTFWARLTEPEGRYADTLYKLTNAGTWQAWGNGDWCECEPPSAAPEFVELDDEAALYLAGALFDAPDSPIDLRTPNPEAWDIAEAARDEIDWNLIDRVIVSAGAPVPGPQSPVTEDYTPEERSKNAEGQLRDANGRFAEVGAKGAVKSSGIGGTITAADPATKQITIAGDDGQEYTVAADDFEVGAAPHPKVDPAEVDDSKLDLDGVLAPDKEAPTPRARMGSNGQILGPVEINDTIDEYSSRINEERQVKAQDFKKLLEHEDAEDDNYEPVEKNDERNPKIAKAIKAAGEIVEDVPVSANEDVPPPSADPTPDSSDVDPVYMAIVDADDPRAVMDLIALVPASATSNEPKTFRRAGGKWVEAPDVLTDLRSATPPPIVQLDANQYMDVLGQVDMEGTNPPAEEGEGDQTITAAGGLDQNRGNAENLRHYWTVGPGGAKIRWGTGGDWTRCVRLLSKHLGNRAKGYCALRHHEMTGMWPGDKKNREMSSPPLVAGGAPIYSSDQLLRLGAVLRASAFAAAKQAAVLRVMGGQEYEPIPPSPEDITEGRSGKAFKIPLVIPEGLATGDGRVFGKGSLGMRTLPLPLLWQIQTGEGHDGSVLVGRIDRVERTANGLGNAYGVFDTGPYGQEAQRLVETKMLRWVSADLDKFEIDEYKSDPEANKMFIKKGRLMGATLVPKPAFQECTIELINSEEISMPRGTAPSAIAASASIAKAIPVEPPSVWFERPILNGPTPITVTDDGQVFGHVATWHMDHIGMAGQVRAPRSPSNYAYFHTGVIRTEDAKDVRVGQLTLAGGHAPIHLNANLAAKHYDDTASAVADVHAGEDSYGIWVAGALRPGTTPEQIRSLRASAPSGDWRSINGRLELVAVCQVNVPGFPVPRSLAASGAMTALVAAGSTQLLAMRTVEDKAQQEADALAIRERFLATLNLDEYLAEKREGEFSLADGSFPIETVSDLRRAVYAFDRATSANKASVRRHIVRRARALSKVDLIPSTWKEATLSEKSLDNRDRYESLVAAARQERVAAIRERVRPTSPEELAAKAAELRKRVSRED